MRAVSHAALTARIEDEHEPSPPQSIGATEVLAPCASQVTISPGIATNFDIHHLASRATPRRRRDRHGCWRALIPEASLRFNYALTGLPRMNRSTALAKPSS